MANIESQASHQPPAQLEYKSRKRLSDAEWDTLAIDLKSGVMAALADRQPLDDNLDDWNALYEMEPGEKNPDWPIKDAANIFVPLIPTQLEALHAYIAGQVFVPNLILVNGLTDDAAKTAHLMERYMNSEIKRQRGSSSWFKEFLKWSHLAMRDGTAYLEVLWKHEKTKLRMTQSQPKMETDPDSGLPGPTLDDEGNPEYEQTEIEVEKILNEADVKAVSLRDVIMLPASAKSIDEARAVIRPLSLYEQDLRKLVNDGVLDADEVEAALENAPAGSTEITSDPQPTGVLTRGEQVGLGSGQGTQASKFFKNRGPILVYRIFSDQYDLDKDGTTEKNIFWIHYATGRMLGWQRYQYFNESWPLFPLSMLPRPDDEIGFSLPGRLAGLQNEKNAQRNQRLDEGVVRLAPPFTVKKGSAGEEWNGQWGPNERITVDQNGPDGDISRLTMEQLPQHTFVEEQIIAQDAQDYTGLNSTAIGQQSSGRRSATEARQRQAAAMTRTGLIAMNVRMAIRPVIYFIHGLNKQYKNSDQQFQVNGERLSLDLQTLSKDYAFEIAGASDPIDAPARRQETIAGLEAMVKLFPQNFQSPVRAFYALRKFCDAFNWADMDQLIGTEQDAMNMQQQMMAAAQAQAQMQAHGQPPQGQPPQGPPQQGPAPNGQPHP